jgi:hypothetical protein
MQCYMDALRGIPRRPNTKRSAHSYTLLSAYAHANEWEDSTSWQSMNPASRPYDSFAMADGPKNEKGDAGLEKVEEREGNITIDEHELNDAFYAENVEHDMGVWEAARTHPMACVWAFVMCFTIVSPRFYAIMAEASVFADTLLRSWRLMTCS